jgi:hypothetical protein
MGNTLSKDEYSDKRFGDSLLAKEVKKIITNQETVYLGKPVKIHLAKACCRDVVRKGIDQEVTNVVSVAFPKALSKDNPRCKTDGICLGTSYVGYQIDDDKDKYCKQGTVIGDINLAINLDKTVKSNSTCDNFMIDYCAKTLYEQGCTKMGKNLKGNIVPQFSNKQLNKMCWNEENKMHYGPPECECLNSVVGTNLNTWPARMELPPFGSDNPYGLEGTKLDTTSKTKYSLNIFNTDSTKQYPVQLDPRCTTGSTSGDSGRSKAYLLSKDNQLIKMNSFQIIFQFHILFIKEFLYHHQCSKY